MLNFEFWIGGSEGRRKPTTSESRAGTAKDATGLHAGVQLYDWKMAISGYFSKTAA